MTNENLNTSSNYKNKSYEDIALDVDFVEQKTSPKKSSTEKTLSAKLNQLITYIWSGFVRLVELILDYADHSVMRGPRIIIWVSLVFFTTFVIWASFFQINQVVNAQGQIIANSRTQIIQAADVGVLLELKVAEGDSVEQGQVIAVLEKDRADASFTESYGKYLALKLTTARLRAEIAGRDFVYDKSLYKNYPDIAETQTNLFKRRKDGYQEQLNVLKDNLVLAEEELNLNLPLEKLGDISKTDILRLKRAVNEAKTNLSNLRNKYLMDASAELNKAEEDLNTQQQVMTDRQQLLSHTDIISPTNGIVKNVRVTTIGGVLRQGDELMQILPTDSDLVVEAKVKPADMAMIKTGLPAKVKLDAFDYSIFGSLQGEVSYVSSDSLIEDSRTGPVTYYRIKVTIDEKSLNENKNKIDLLPGMTGTVDIKTRDRSVMSFILKPITKTLSQSLKER
jgi:adhesin transport system membrane fusion protein